MSCYTSVDRLTHQDGLDGCIATAFVIIERYERRGLPMKNLNNVLFACFYDYWAFVERFRSV